MKGLYGIVFAIAISILMVSTATAVPLVEKNKGEKTSNLLDILKKFSSSISTNGNRETRGLIPANPIGAIIVAAIIAFIIGMLG